MSGFASRQSTPPILVENIGKPFRRVAIRAATDVMIAFTASELHQ